jgi:hypothetical protein
MPNNDINTPVAEVVEIPATPETTVEQTIGDVLDAEVQAPAEKPANLVPESVFLSEKKARKEAEKMLKELKEKLSQDTPKREVSSDIASIAKKYDVDPDFLEEVKGAINLQSKKEIEEELSLKFKPLEEEKRQAKIDKAFDEHYQKAMAAMPEFSNVVNANVIKSLSLLPQNANKTFSQLIEETYGNAITGRRTIQTTVAGGGKEPAPLDYHRANRDPAYFKEIMANPKLKEEYNYIMLRDGS